MYSLCIKMCFETLELFARQINHQFLRLFVRGHYMEAEGKDAVCLPQWTRVPYAFHPFRLIPKILIEKRLKQSEVLLRDPNRPYCP